MKRSVSNSGILLLVVSLMIALLSTVGFRITYSEAVEAQKVQIITGMAGGGFWTIAASIGPLIKKVDPNIFLTVLPGSTISNIPYVHEKKAEFGMTLTGYAPSALRGEAPFPAKMVNVRGIATLDPIFFVFVVTPATPVNSFPEIIEKKYPLKIAIEAPGGITQLLIGQLLKNYGIKLTTFEQWGGKIFIVASHSEAVGLVRDGHANAWFMFATLGHPQLTELTTVRKMKFIPVPEDIVQSLERDYGHRRYIIPAKSFPGQTTEILTMGMSPVFIAHKDVPEDVVYAFAKAISEYKSDMALSPRSQAMTDPQTWWQGTIFPLHPGAERYFKEKGWMK